MVNDLDVRHPRDRSLERQQVVIERGAFELAAGLDDDQEVARILDLAIAEPALAKQLGAAHLEVDEVAGVMEQAHPVGLGIADADGHLMLERIGHDLPGSLNTMACNRWASGSPLQGERPGALRCQGLIGRAGTRDDHHGQRIVRPLLAVRLAGPVLLGGPASKDLGPMLEPVLRSQSSY